MKKGASERLTQKQRSEAEALANLPDESIDTSDIPEIPDWSGARRGLFYRPIKKQITLRLDADVLSWFKASTPDGRGYQTEINRVLREHTQWASKQVSAPERAVAAIVGLLGLRQKPYRDSAGKLATGAGLNVADKGYTEALARRLLDEVSKEARRELDNVTWWSEAPQEERDELLSRWEELLGHGFPMALLTSSVLEKWLATAGDDIHSEIEANAEDDPTSKLRGDH